MRHAVTQMQSPQLEYELLGELLLDPERIDDVSEIAEPEAFTDTRNREAFSGMIAARRRGTLPDEHVVAPYLAAIGDNNQAFEYLAAARIGVNTAIFAVQHANQLQHLHLLRRTRALASRLVAELPDVNPDAESTRDVIEGLQREALTLAMPGDDGRGESFDSIAKRLLARLADTGRCAEGLRTGFGDLDKLLSGLRGGDLALLAARPSVGKTAFALQIAINFATHRHPCLDDRHGRVAFFSVEMSSDQLVERVASIQSGVDLARIRMGRLDISERNAIATSLDELQGSGGFTIFDSPKISIASMRAKCRRLHALDGLDAVVVDYLQLVTSGAGRRRNATRAEEVGEISRGLKELAREVNVPVLALAQLNRDVEKRGDNAAPKLSDLRESGSLEQDADVVMLLDRPNKGKDLASEDDRALAWVDIAKHRNGATGKVKLRFDAGRARFLTPVWAETVKDPL